MPTDSFNVAVRELVVYQRLFSRANLAELLDTDLADADDVAIARLVTDNLAVAEILHHYGRVEHERWHIQPADQPPPPATGSAAAVENRPTGTHDYRTVEVLARDLTAEHTLVGESGGLSAVDWVRPSDAMPGLLCVETEHGPLYLDPDHTYLVLADA